MATTLDSCPRPRARIAMLLVLSMLAACSGDLTSAPPTRRVGDGPRFDLTPTHGAADSLRALAATRGIVALPPAPAVRKELAVLGRALVFDPILSGNRNM